MWQRRLWPYRELKIGDTVYWYDSTAQAIVWKTTVSDVVRFEYENKEQVRQRFHERFEDDPIDDPYYVEASDHGYCLVYKVTPVEQLNLPKPADYKFPQVGWLRSNDADAQGWLSHLPLENEDGIYSPQIRDNVRHWWVNQNQTYKAEVDGGYVWSPQTNKNGARNQFYENMREVSRSDLVFSFRDRRISDIGVATSNCCEARKPDEFGAAGQNWEKVGWRADVAYIKNDNPITPKYHIELIRPLLPDKYSPLQQNGDGLQSVYLAELSDDLADFLKSLVQQAGNTFPSTTSLPNTDQADTVLADVEGHLEADIRQPTTIDETEKGQLVKSRRGQGKFRENVQEYEVHWRITGVSDARFLIASHIKPWRSSTNQERLDGQNGLLLTPNVDALFDRGSISFDDDGALLISPVING